MVRGARHLGEGSATFIGDAVERFPPAKPGEAGKPLELWNNLVWIREGTDWLLVDTVKGRTPGTALDVAMGHGRNAIYLASRGWKHCHADPGWDSFGA